MKYFILRSSVYPGKIYIRKDWIVWLRTSSVLTLTFDLQRSFIVPFESLSLTPYLSSIDIFPPYRTVLKMIDYNALRVWPWPLTFRSHLWSEYFCYSKANTSLPIWLLVTFNLVHFLRYLASKFLGFDVDLWPLKVTWGQKYSHYSKDHTDFLSNSFCHFLSISYRFRNIRLEIFRVRLWHLTLKGHLGSRIFSSFESPCMTSYLSSMDTFSLSHTVFEIFDFKTFMVGPWPLTFEGHLGSKIFPPFESPCMASYPTSIDIFSLSRTVFEIFDFQVFRIWPWPLTFEGHLGSKIFLPFRKSMHDFLSNFYWHFLSISYRFRDIRF